jgi:hypothetical protein
MATMRELLEADHAFRAMLDDNNVPQPDIVEYGHGTIWARWNDRKLVVAIDVDEPPPAASDGPGPVAD